MAKSTEGELSRSAIKKGAIIAFGLAGLLAGLFVGGGIYHNPADTVAHDVPGRGRGAIGRMFVLWYEGLVNGGVKFVLITLGCAAAGVLIGWLLGLRIARSLPEEKKRGQTSNRAKR